MKTASDVAEGIVRQILNARVVSYSIHGELIAQALTSYAAEATDYYYKNIALNMAKQARAEGWDAGAVEGQIKGFQRGLETAAKAVEDEISGRILHAEGLPEFLRSLKGPSK